MRWLIRLFFRTLRLVLGPLMLLWARVTTPRGIEREAADQARVDAETAKLSLYQFATCPFCLKVRREMKRLSLNIELRDAQHNPDHRAALMDGGGEVKVPCLRIVDETGKDTWLYESADIIRYLQQRFA